MWSFPRASLFSLFWPKEAAAVAEEEGEEVVEVAVAVVEVLVDLEGAGVVAKVGA